MSNRWTGGQYSLFRMVLGAYLVFYFLNIDQAWDIGSWRATLAVLGALLAGCLCVGSHDRQAAVLISLLWVVSHLSGPAPAPYVWAPLAIILLLHARLPGAPYLSWAARGRADPGGGWRMPDGLYLAAWAVLSVGYAGLGITRLFDPSWLEWSSLRGEEAGLAGGIESVLWAGPWAFVGIEILFGPLAMVRRARPFVWALMMARHLAFAAGGGAGPVDGLLLAHLFIFDPRWIRAASAGAAGTLFYDGHCGFCHRSVRFLLAEDREGRAFRFAPLQGETFAREVPEAGRAALPDSLVLRTPEGRLLVRARCMRAIAARLGGVWRLAGMIGALVPIGVADVLYDGFARIRHRLFARPPDLCPLVPADLRARFDS